MATLEAVTIELQNLNGFSDLQLDTTLEQNERIGELSKESKFTNQLLSEILDVMEQFMNNVPEQIVRGFEPLVQNIENINQETTNIISQKFEEQLEFERTRDKLQEREEEVEEQKETKKPEKVKSGLGGEFMRRKEEAEESSIFDILDNALGIAAIVGGLGAALGMVSTVLAGLGTVFASLAIVVGGVIAVVNGVMTAFEFFQSQEGDLGDKLLAGIRGFLTGIAEVVAWPLDFIRNLLSEGLESLFPGNEVSKFLDSFTFLNLFRDFFNMMATLFEDMFQFLDEIGVTDALVNGFNAVRNFMTDLVEGLGTIVNFVFAQINKVRELIGLDPLSSGGADVNVVKLSEDEQDAAIESARQSKLYDKNIIGASVVDETKLKDATTKQLQAIVNDDDLTAAQREVVVKELMERQETKQRDSVVTEQTRTQTNVTQNSELTSSETQTNQSSSQETVLSSPSIERSDVAPAMSTLNVISAPETNIEAAGPNQNISTSNDRSEMTSVMVNEQNKLNNSKMEMQTAGSNSASVVDASTRSTVVNNQTINTGPIPSPMDKSDRTDRRGPFRGKWGG